MSCDNGTITRLASENVGKVCQPFSGDTDTYTHAHILIVQAINVT